MKRMGALGPIARRDRDLELRARPLQIHDHGDGTYSVASATSDTWHVVDARAFPWTCDCQGANFLCSHKRRVRQHRGQYQQVPRGGAT